MLKFAKPKLLNLTRKRKLRARLSMSLFTSLLSGGGGGYGGRINVRQINLKTVRRRQVSKHQGAQRQTAKWKIKNQINFFLHDEARRHDKTWDKLPCWRCNYLCCFENDSKGKLFFFNFFFSHSKHWLGYWFHLKSIKRYWQTFPGGTKRLVFVIWI